MEIKKGAALSLPKGYKLTEVGVIPIEWQIIVFGELTEKIIGGGTPDTNKEEYFYL